MSKELNLKDGWEEQINRQERIDRIDRAYAARRQKKYTKLGFRAATCAGVSMLLLALGLTGALTPWIAAPVGMVLAGVSCFMFGQVKEGSK